jgi:hypothetical protein
MESNLITRRLIEAGALLLVGDGVMSLLTPRWHSLVGYAGPQLVKAATEELAARRTAARVVGAAEIALGVALFASQRCED